MKILVVSTPVAALGTGGGGGVELSLYNITQVLSHRGYTIRIAAPEGSQLHGLETVEIIQIPGNLQISAQTQTYDAAITMPSNPVLGNLWHYAWHVQDEYDLIFNLSYDWLPFFLTPCFRTPIAHLVSMGSLSAAMDEVISAVVAQFPHTIGVYTHTQAATFPFRDACYPLSSGLDLSLYTLSSAVESRVLGWMGRISPEKGLEDAFAAAQATGMRLRIFGLLQDRPYWDQILATYPDVDYDYRGFLDTHNLQQQLNSCAGLLVTSRWVEAFGNVAIEALACGVPVIAYRRGGLAEIVRDGQSGWLVEPDSVQGLVVAIAKLSKIDRQQCRRQAEQEYSLTALGDRMEAWFQTILASALPK